MKSEKRASTFFVFIHLIVIFIFASCLSGRTTKESDSVVYIPNPVTKATPRQIMEGLGVEFLVPLNATDISYSIIADKIAQMSFIWINARCCARIQSTSQLEDISGMYYEWNKEEPCRIGWCDGVVKLLDKENSDESTGVCLWYDAAPGLMYSLSMEGNANVDNLTNLAQQIYKTTQKEVP